MPEAIIPSQPTPTEIASVLRAMSGKEPELHRVASSSGRELEFWHEHGDIVIRVECEYGYAIRDSRSHFAPVGGLLLEAVSTRGGQETVSKIAEAFGGYVLNRSLDRGRSDRPGGARSSRSEQGGGRALPICG